MMLVETIPTCHPSQLQLQQTGLISATSVGYERTDTFPFYLRHPQSEGGPGAERVLLPSQLLRLQVFVPGQDYVFAVQSDCWTPVPFWFSLVL